MGGSGDGSGWDPWETRNIERAKFGSFNLIHEESDEKLIERFQAYLQELPNRVTVNESGWHRFKTDDPVAMSLLLTIGERLADNRQNHPALKTIEDAFVNNYETYNAFESAALGHVSSWGNGSLSGYFGDFKECQRALEQKKAAEPIARERAQANEQLGRDYIGFIKKWALRSSWRYDTDAALRILNHMERRTTGALGRGLPVERRLAEEFRKISGGYNPTKEQAEEFREIAKTVLGLRGPASVLGLNRF